MFVGKLGTFVALGVKGRGMIEYRNGILTYKWWKMWTDILGDMDIWGFNNIGYYDKIEKMLMVEWII